MLSTYLKNAAGALGDLIDLTRQDIDDIKAARHDALFGRVKLKEEVLGSFEHYKSLIDREISRKIQDQPTLPLEALISEEDHTQLDALKVKLAELKEANLFYGKLVVAVSGFYNALMERCLPPQMQADHLGYGTKKVSRAAFLTAKG